MTSELNALRDGLAAVARTKELEAIIAAKDMEIVALHLALADRDHRIKVLQAEVSARSKATEFYRRLSGSQ